jgi:hypothetical protein
MAVWIVFGSDVAGMDGAQAWMAISKAAPVKSFRIVFSICPPFDLRLHVSHCSVGYSCLSLCSLEQKESNYKGAF